MKLNLAVAELPRLRGEKSRDVQPYHRGLIQITKPLTDLDRDQDGARARRRRRGRAHRAVHSDRARPVARA